jgi:hypothetical protein
MIEPRKQPKPKSNITNSLRPRYPTPPGGTPGSRHRPLDRRFGGINPTHGATHHRHFVS